MNKKIFVCTLIIFVANLIITLFAIIFSNTKEWSYWWIFLITFVVINIIIAFFQTVIYYKNIDYFEKARTSYEEEWKENLPGFSKISFIRGRLFTIGQHDAIDLDDSFNFRMYISNWLPIKPLLIFCVFPAWFYLKLKATNKYYSLKEKNKEA